MTLRGPGRAGLGVVLALVGLSGKAVPGPGEEVPESSSKIAAAAGEVEHPNIVLIYIDDWAWNGSPVAMDDAMVNARMPVLQMPNVERLAREGMKFRNAYGSPQCSPARVCVQTGQSSPRNGFTVYLGAKEPYYDTRKPYQHYPVIPNVADQEIDPEAVTIAEALEPLGYVSAHLGKWHMRGDPGEHGYAVHDGNTTNGPGNTIKAGLGKDEASPKRLPREMTDPKLMFSVTARAIEFMEEQAGAGTPFYVQISHYAMHAGRECLDETRRKYVDHPLVQAWYRENKKDPATIGRKDDPANWLAMGEDLDGRIGAVLEKIDELGIRERTYVVLTADNGYRHRELLLAPGLKQPLHGRKWWLWEGGLRVPMIVRGPGIEAGSVFEGNVVNYDFLPTFLDWAGGDPAALENLDGLSLAPYLGGMEPDAAFLTRNLYFHYPHYRSSMPHAAMISGTSKVMHFFERPALPILFDLAQDLGEVENVAERYPDTHKRLHGEMMAYLRSVKARLPKRNPEYDPAVYRSAKEYDERMKLGPFAGRRHLAEDEK